VQIRKHIEDNKKPFFILRTREEKIDKVEKAEKKKNEKRKLDLKKKLEKRTIKADEKKNID
jgi:hypothetical protein